MIAGRVMISLLLLLMVLGRCSPEQTDQRDILARVNDYELTREEFQQQLASEMELDKDFKLTDEAKGEFLEGLIRKELLIQEAKRRKLDREDKFIRAIERYWESTLIRDLLETKGSEIQKSTVVSEEEIETRYRERKASNEGLPPLEEIRDELTQEILEEKKSRALKGWIDGLREEAKVEINEELMARDQ
jgi:hypothetical protein